MKHLADSLHVLCCMCSELKRRLQLLKRCSGGFTASHQRPTLKHGSALEYALVRSFDVSISIQQQIYICLKCFLSRRPNKWRASAVKGSSDGGDLGAKLRAADATVRVGRKAFIYRSAVCRSNSIEGKMAAVGEEEEGKRVCVCVCACCWEGCFLKN